MSKIKIGDLVRTRYGSLGYVVDNYIGTYIIGLIYDDIPIFRHRKEIFKVKNEDNAILKLLTEECIKDAKTLKLKSLDYGIKFHEQSVEVGCQKIKLNDMDLFIKKYKEIYERT